MITEGFNDIKWVNSLNTPTIQYAVDVEGKVLGTVKSDGELYTAVFDYKVLGKYIDSSSAKRAIEKEVSKK